MCSWMEKNSRPMDPFAPQPLPKSFYHPSPTKDVDKLEAIYSPQKNMDNKRSALEEQYILRSNTYKTSAVPDFKTVTRSRSQKETFGVGKDGSNVCVESDQYDEAWPESERPSADTSRNMSNLTSGLEESMLRTSHVEASEMLAKWCNRNNSAADEDTCQESQTSVLQKYIERFRYSAPKPREERLRESSGAKREFWWLNSDSSPQMAHHPNVKVTEAEKDRDASHISKFNAGQKNKVKLTKEVLLAMDEQTLELQKKAETLLSRSELSLASSGPIVSTDGLGSSMSLSEPSVKEEPVSHKSTLVHHLTNLHGGSRAMHDDQRYIERMGGEPRREALHHSSGYQGSPDDILIRWRTRRKMEESGGGRGDTVPHTHAKKSEFSDPRLEEFRKKLFAQRALVIQNDIDFERQRMTMLMEDEEEVHKMVHKPEKSHQQQQPQLDDFTVDPVLQRLSHITGRALSGPSFVLQHNVESFQTSSHQALQNQNQSMNVNASNMGQRVCNLDDNLMAQNIASLNVNNTAEPNGATTSNQSCEIQVDAIKSQEICDPKSKAYILDSGQQTSCLQITGQHDAESSEHIDNFDGRKEAESEERHEQFNQPSPKILDSCKVTEKQVFHQVLEAEKPSELDEQRQGLGSKDSSHVDENVEISYSSDKVKSRQSDSDSQAGDRKSESKTKKKASKRKNVNQASNEASHRDRQSGESDALSDVTNDSDRSSRKSSGRHRKHERDSVKKDIAGKYQKPELEEQKRERVYKEQTRRKEVESEAPTRKIGRPVPSGSPQPHSVSSAVGQIISNRLFDGSVLVSSVDSWASAFPPSPGTSRSLHETVLTPPSPPRLGQGDIENEPLQSTPIAKESKENVIATEDLMATGYESDEDFSDDPLLQILRHQRTNYLEQLKLIEMKLQ